MSLLLRGCSREFPRESTNFEVRMKADKEGLGHLGESLAK